MHLDRRFPIVSSGLNSIVLWLICLLGFSLLSVAQTGTATLSGTVTDPSGAVIPGVQIQVVHEDTNVSVTTSTNEAGIYVVPSLKPGQIGRASCRERV